MKIRLATVWLGGCAGCHMSFLDLDEFLIDLADAVELVYSPVVDIKEYPENVDLCLIEGAVCNQDNLEMLHQVRARTKTLVAFGDCAVTGNVPAMRDQLGLGSVESVLQRAYIENAQNNPSVPQADGIVPQLLPRVVPVQEIVHIEYFLPGCPPPAARIKALVGQLLAGAEPKLEGANLKFG
jgi:NAD-reducing hydrogenase small subunit